MKKLITVLSIFVLVMVSQPGEAQNSVNNKFLTGSWLGKISAGAIELRVIFNLTIVPKDSLVATLDSPDQGAMNIKLGTVTFTGEKLRIVAPLLLAEYNGSVKNDTVIEGTWKQGAAIMPLNLTKLKTVFAPNRSK